MAELDWFPALAAFLAVALMVGAAALVWEAFQAYRRQRAASGALERMQAPGRPGVLLGQPESLLDEEDATGAGRLLSGLFRRLPQRADMRRRLEQAGLDWSPETFLLISLGSAGAFFVFALLLADAFLAPLVAAVALFFPWLYVGRQRTKRAAAFEAAFPEALDLMTRAIRSGQAFGAGLQVVSEEAEEPVRSEFKQVHEEVRFGYPVDESLEAMADRVELLDVRLFVTAIAIQRESGGNLAEKLQNLSEVIRARFKFRRQIRTHTAHGRLTGTILALLPVILGFLIYLVNPDYMRPLFTESLGRWMIFGTVVMMTFGFLMIRRIVDIKV